MIICLIVCGFSNCFSNLRVSFENRFCLVRETCLLHGERARPPASESESKLKRSRSRSVCCHCAISAKGYAAPAPQRASRAAATAAAAVTAVTAVATTTAPAIVPRTMAFGKANDVLHRIASCPCIVRHDAGRSCLRLPSASGSRAQPEDAAYKYKEILHNETGKFACRLKEISVIAGNTTNKFQIFKNMMDFGI